jgi:cytochrome b561
MIRIRNSRTHWGIVSQGVHWITAVLVVAMIVIGLIMVDLPLGVRKLELYALHKSVGVVILALTAARLVWRLSGTRPLLLGALRPYERVLAHGVHISFYVVLVAMPLTGWLMSSASNFSVNVFGLFTLPNLVAPDKALADVFEAAHYWLGWVLVGLLALHVAGALKHHFFLGNDTLRRMIPGWRRRGQEDRISVE